MPTRSLGAKGGCLSSSLVFCSSLSASESFNRYTMLFYSIYSKSNSPLCLFIYLFSASSQEHHYYNEKLLFCEGKFPTVRVKRVTETILFFISPCVCLSPSHLTGGWPSSRNRCPSQSTVLLALFSPSLPPSVPLTLSAFHPVVEYKHPYQETNTHPPALPSLRSPLTPPPLPSTPSFVCICLPPLPTHS